MNFYLALIFVFVLSYHASAQVRINEFCAKNASGLADEDNDESDWIELYNGGNTDVNLSGFALKDDNELTWIFPPLILPSQSFLIVFASGKNRFGPVLHSSFKISSEGETLRLYDSNGQLLDEMPPVYLRRDHSAGRYPDGHISVPVLFETPTPGASNNSSLYYAGYATPPVMSLAPGFYLQSVLLNITGIEGDIRYTLDGSYPDNSMLLYNGPLQLDTSVVIRAQSVSSDPVFLPSEYVTATYIIGYTSELPVVSLSSDPDNLWDWNTGIYVLGPNASPIYPYHGANFWQDWERPVHVEFFETNGVKIFDQEAGVSINGGSVSRTRPMQSLRLTARDKYGSSVFSHRFFEQKDIEEFKILVLRNSSGDFNKTHFRDGSLHKLMIGKVDIGLLCYRPSAVFINGQYWGVHNIREKVSKHYLEENYGIDEENVDLLEEDSTVIQGDYTEFNAMQQFIAGSDLSNETLYDSAKKMLDVISFADYFIAETYLSNIDWPYNNIKYWKVKSPGNKWRYLLMDLDISLGNLGWAPASLDVLGRVMGPYGYNNKHAKIFKSLIRNTEFRNHFINRYADLVNTIFRSEYLKNHIEEVKSVIEPEMPMHFNRWGNTMQGWYDEIYNVVMPYVEGRPAYALQYVQDTFQLKQQVQLTLDVWPPQAGVIRLNTITPQDYPWNGIYFDGVPVTMTIIPNPGFTFSEWQSDNIQITGNRNVTITLNVDRQNKFTAFFRSADGNNLNIYPNPAQHSVSAGFILDKDGEGYYDLTDNYGKIVLSSSRQHFTKGINQINVVVENLASGVYVMNFYTTQNKFSSKLVILK